MPLFNHSPSDAMQLLGLGELPQPATCMACGSGTCEEGYVNTGVWFEWEGTMLLCVPCLTQLGELAGLRVPAEIKIIEDLNQQLSNVVTQLETALEAKNAELNAAYSVLRNGNLGPAPAVRSGSLFDEAPVKQPESDQPVAGSTVSGTDSGEPKPEEPVKGSGRSNTKRTKLLDTPPGENTIKL